MFNDLKRNKSLLLLFLSIIVIIILYGKFRCVYTNYVDPLEIDVDFHIDGWSISHYVLFTIVGYNFPKSFFFAMFMGVLWEIIEHMIGAFKPSILNGITNCNRKSTKESSSDTAGYWWYGKKEDIVVNFLGFITGHFIYCY